MSDPASMYWLDDNLPAPHPPSNLGTMPEWDWFSFGLGVVHTSMVGDKIITSPIPLADLYNQEKH